jgi:hypothetical protein
MPQQEDFVMRRPTLLVLSVTVALLGASSAFAQSQPNFGPNAPATGDTYGKPPSGTNPPPSGAAAYAYRSHSWHWRRHHHRHHHHY